MYTTSNVSMKHSRQNKHSVTARSSLLLASNLMNILGFAMFLPLYGAYILSLGQQPESGSFLWSVHTLVVGIMVLVFGRIEDRRSRYLPKALITGNVLQVLGTVGFLTMDTFIGFAAGLMVYSVGTAILAPAWFSLFSLNLHKQHHARGWSYSQGGGALAGALGSAAGGVLFALTSYPGVFLAGLVMHTIGPGLAIKSVAK